MKRKGRRKNLSNTQSNPGLPAVGGDLPSGLIGLVAALNPLESIHKMYLTRKAYEIEIRRIEAMELEMERVFELRREKLAADFKVTMDKLHFEAAKLAADHYAFHSYLEDGRKCRQVREESLDSLTKAFLEQVGRDGGGMADRILPLIDAIRSDLRNLDDSRRDALFELLNRNDGRDDFPSLPGVL